MKRKTAALCLALMLPFVLLAGCNRAAAPEPDPPFVLEPVPPIDGPVHTGTDIASSPFVGDFVNSYSALYASLAGAAYSDAEHTPRLSCAADGTFSLTVLSDVPANIMRTVTGTFTVDGDIASCVVDGSGEAFTLTLINAEEMRYAGDSVDSVYPGDIFERAAADAA